GAYYKTSAPEQSSTEDEIEELHSPQTRGRHVLLSSHSYVSYSTPSAENFSTFGDCHVPRLVSLSFTARAQASFKEMVEASHLYEGPLFSVLGRFIRDDGSVLQCVAYQRRAIPDHQYDRPSLGSCLDNLRFDFHEHLVDGLDPSAPNWVSLQGFTTPQMSAPMKQALWSLSKVVLSNRLKEVEGGFFTCLHQTRELRTIQNGEQIPIYSVRPAAVDAVVPPHHNHELTSEPNRGCLPQILGIYREEYRLGMCNLMEDWLMVFVALLDHFFSPDKQFVLNACLNYFLSLAEIEEQAALYAGVPFCQDMTYAETKAIAQSAAKEMFRSVQRHMNLPLRIPMRAEIENARIFGDMMSRWTMGSHAMPPSIHDKHEDYFCPNIGRERRLLTETLKSAHTISGSIVPANIPGYTPPEIARQVRSHHSKSNFSLFRL
ncbi:hypothetical protein B0H14DRAFT_2914499, partial [Mycena olivaceomarginata]